jgi:hypothetical protein
MRGLQWLLQLMPFYTLFNLFRVVLIRTRTPGFHPGLLTVKPFRLQSKVVQQLYFAISAHRTLRAVLRGPLPDAKSANKAQRTQIVPPIITEAIRKLCEACSLPAGRQASHYYSVACGNLVQSNFHRAGIGCLGINYKSLILIYFAAIHIRFCTSLYLPFCLFFPRELRKCTPYLINQVPAQTC